MPLAAPKSTKISLFEPPTGPSRHQPPLDSLTNFDRRPLSQCVVEMRPSQTDVGDRNERLRDKSAARCQGAVGYGVVC
jgi:hypothetical protein